MPTSQLGRTGLDLWEPLDAEFHPKQLFWFAVPFNGNCSKNAIYGRARDGHVYLKPDARDFQCNVGLLTAASARDVKINHAKPVWLSAMVYKTNNRGDAINLIDLVADGVKLGLGYDDRYFKLWRWDYEVRRDDVAEIIIAVGQ